MTISSENFDRVSRLLNELMEDLIELVEVRLIANSLRNASAIFVEGLRNGKHFTTCELTDYLMENTRADQIAASLNTSAIHATLDIDDSVDKALLPVASHCHRL